MMKIVANSMTLFSNSRLLEAVGSIFGIAGALIMALRPELAPLAWGLWLVSSVALLFFARANGLAWLATLQAIFTVINLIGLHNASF